MSEDKQQKGKCHSSKATEGTSVKIYLVIQKVNLPKEGEPNRVVVAAKLTRSAADAIVNQVAGCYVHKIRADKLLPELQ